MEEQARHTLPASSRAVLAAAEALAVTLVGWDEASGVAAVEEAGFVARVRQRDGQGFPLRANLRPDRINLTVQSGRITDAEVF